MKKFLVPAVASVIVSGIFCPAFTVNAAGETKEFYIDNNSVVFHTQSEPDIITSTLNKFSIERFSGMYGAAFVPEEDGYYVVSIVQNYNESIIDTADGSHVHYFYPTVQTYSVIKDGEDITVRDAGKYSGYSKETVSGLSESESIVCFDYYEKAELSDYYYGVYYSLVNGYMPSDCYFTYFDYAYETADKKDCSQFLLSGPYASPDEIPFRVSGNSELIETGYASSSATSDDIFNYYIYAPTGDGETEFTFKHTAMAKSVVVSSENGQYIPHINIISSVDRAEKGDVNTDGKTGIADIVLLQKYLLGSADITKSQMISADLNSDGSVDVYDMILLRKLLAE